MNRGFQTKEDTVLCNTPIPVRSSNLSKKNQNNSGQTSHISRKIGQELMKDSGIGTTYLATSSGSTSENTSPESEKDAQIENGKAPKTLSSSTIGAASTPATAINKYKAVGATSQLEIKATRKQVITCQDLTFDEDNSIHKLGTPLTSRNKTTNKYKQLEKTQTTRPTYTNASDNKEVIAKLIENFNEASQTPGRKRQRRMHACEFCDKQFDRPSLLKRHNLTHTGERPFECRFCSKGFSTRSGVNTHERTHTGQRPYVCRICGRRFAAGSNLIFHKYTHTNTRRHVCNQCPKAFVTPGDLRKHEYTHTGEWPFRCHLCDRGFATERNLRSHEITHTGQKPHICPICGKGYAQESSMKTHIRSHQKSNGAKLDKVCGSASKSENKPPAMEPQTCVMTPLTQNNVNPRSGWQLNSDVHPNPFGLPNTKPSVYGSGYLVNTESVNVGLSHPPNIEHQQHRSAFSIPQSTSGLIRNTVQHQLSETMNPMELQSLLYDRYRVYYELYMKALSDPHENPMTGSIWSQNISPSDSSNIIFNPNFYSAYVPLASTQPLIHPQYALSNQTFDHSVGRHHGSSALPQVQSTSTHPSVQEISSPNLILRSPVQSIVQPPPRPSTTQPQNTHNHNNNDFDLQPLDYSIRGLSSFGRK